MNKFKAFLAVIAGALSMNANSLRNLLTVVFGVGGIGLTAIFPHINPVWSIVIALWVRAGMDEFWPATGITKDWKNSLRNFLTVILASGEVLHQYLPFIPVGSCAGIALGVRAAMDQLWPATPAGPSVVEGKPVIIQQQQIPPFTALSDAKAKMEQSTLISRAQFNAVANDPSVVEKGPDYLKLKNGTVLRVDPSKP